MDAVDLLIKQHRDIEARLDRALEAGDPGTRAKVVAEIGDHLGVHLESEEQAFYPAVRARRTEDILLESLEEHLSLKRLLADLLALAATEETFVPKLKVLAEQVEHHHEEEEEHLFPKVKELLDAAERDALGKAMLDMQQRMQRETVPGEVMAEQTEKAAELK